MTLPSVIGEVKILFLLAVRRRSVISWEHLPHQQGVFVWSKRRRWCLQHEFTDFTDFTDSFWVTVVCRSGQKHTCVTASSHVSFQRRRGRQLLKETTNKPSDWGNTFTMCVSGDRNPTMTTFGDGASLQTLKRFVFILFWSRNTYLSSSLKEEKKKITG